MVDFVIGREDFSRRLSEELGCKYRAFRHQYHPDGEPTPRILADYGEIDGKHLVLVLRGKEIPDYTRVSRNLHNFSRHIDNLKYVFRAGAVDVLMPYCWLARSDKNPRTDADPLVRERDQGCDVGYEWLARDFKAHGANRIITFNPHFNRGKLGSFKVEGIEFIALSGIPALVRYAKRLYDDRLLKDDLLVVGPDFKSNHLVEDFVNGFGGTSKILDKSRLSPDYSEGGKEKVDARGRGVIILDDIFSTGGTVENTVDRIENSSGKSCFVIHGVFPESGFQRAQSLVKGKLRRIVATDTIESSYSASSVIPEVVEFYRKAEQ